MYWAKLDLSMCLDLCRIKNQTEIGRQKELEEHIKLVQQCDYYAYDEEDDSYIVNPLSDQCVSFLIRSSLAMIRPIRKPNL